ncbi:MAG: YifB family Mg chelatase-like AAA ATPase [Pseudomonadota bacterium]
MYGRVTTLAFVGIDARPVDVEVRLTSGNHQFNIVGLPDKAVAESRERVRGALHAIGLGMPHQRVTVNLAPADLPKEGSHFDLPIALALMIAMEAVSPDAIAGFAVVGELALDGAVRDVPGGLPAAIGANAIGKGLICPRGSGPEAVWAGDGVEVIAAPHLLSLINHLRGTQVLARPEARPQPASGPVRDLADVRGQETAKRALEVAAAGGHNLLMIGPPGSGKSMLAQRLPSILPELTPEEMLSVSMVHSLAGELTDGALCTARPFRAPHHSASMAALVGGGSRPRPGEVSLAHHGVLFLDELPEFGPQVLDGLRQPLETGETVIARANHRITYPSQVQLIAAMNPCKCGGGPGRTCRRGARCAAEYQARISGPLFDRIDMVIEVGAVSAADLCLPPAAEGSAEVRARVIAARGRQIARYQVAVPEADALQVARAPALSNAAASANALEAATALGPAAQALLRSAAERFGLSARGFHRTLRVARTLADLDAVPAVAEAHIAEALGYRSEVRGADAGDAASGAAIRNGGPEISAATAA